MAKSCDGFEVLARALIPLKYETSEASVGKLDIQEQITKRVMNPVEVIYMDLKGPFIIAFLWSQNFC